MELSLKQVYHPLKRYVKVVSMIIICLCFFARLVEQCRCILQLVSVAFLDICQRTKKRMTFHIFSLSLTLTRNGIYSVFHQFRQAKFAYGGSILSSSQFFVSAEGASKNDTRYEIGQNWLKNNHHPTLIYIGETDCSLVFRMQSGRWAVKDFEIWLLKEFVREFKRNVCERERSFVSLLWGRGERVVLSQELENDIS